MQGNISVCSKHIPNCCVNFFRAQAVLDSWKIAPVFLWSVLSFDFIAFQTRGGKAPFLPLICPTNLRSVGCFLHKYPFHSDLREMGGGGVGETLGAFCCASSKGCVVREVANFLTDYFWSYIWGTLPIWLKKRERGRPEESDSGERWTLRAVRTGSLSFPVFPDLLTPPSSLRYSHQGSCTTHRP